MSTSAATTTTTQTYSLPAIGGGRPSTTPTGLQSSGSLDQFASFESTPAIGTEFAKGSVQIRDLLKSERSDEYLRDLAILGE